MADRFSPKQATAALTHRAERCFSGVFEVLRQLVLAAVLLHVSGAVASSASTGKTQWSELSVAVDAHEFTVNVRAPEESRDSLQVEGKINRLPVIVFLHGAGERGESSDLVRSVGFPTADLFAPHILVVPQVPKGRWWSDEAMINLVMASLESALFAWNGDRNRVYLTGLSMGGHGALQIAARYPDQFAAVLAICPRLGRPTYLGSIPELPTTARTLARRLRSVPLWLFHGSDDEVVPVRNSRDLAAALNRLHAYSRYTEIPGGDHNIWRQVYSRPDVLEWMYDQALGTRSAPQRNQLAN